jgi:hypothetical protein
MLIEFVRIRNAIYETMLTQPLIFSVDATASPLPLAFSLPFFFL